MWKSDSRRGLSMGPRRRGDKMKREKKKRRDRVRSRDRGQEKRVPNGRGYRKVKVVAEGLRGKRWGERVPTTKPCLRGANRQLRSKGKKR